MLSQWQTRAKTRGSGGCPRRWRPRRARAVRNRQPGKRPSHPRVRAHPQKPAVSLRERRDAPRAEARYLFGVMAGKSSPGADQAAPRALQSLSGRYDRDTFEPQGVRARVRLAVAEGDAWDAVIEGDAARLEPARGSPTRSSPLTRKRGSGRRRPARRHGRLPIGRLYVRRNLHVGVGFLAATSGATDRSRLRFRTVATRRARLSVVEAGLGPPLLALHGLGGDQGVLPADGGGTGAGVPGDRGRPARVRRLRQADRRPL